MTKRDARIRVSITAGEGRGTVDRIIPLGLTALMHPARVARMFIAAVPIFACAGAGAASDPAPAFDRDLPRWTELDFSASKFLMSATATVQMRIRPSREIASELKSTPAGKPVAPGDEVLEMVYAASGFGRASLTTLWADPVSGATLQRTQLDQGERRRTYRFTDIGAYHYTRWPAATREESLGPEQWTRRTEGMRPYSDGAAGKPVTEGTVLLWMVGAADLSKKGDRLEAFTFSRKRVNRVVAEVIGTRTVQVDFIEKSASGEHRRRGDLNALRLRVRGSPLTPVKDEDEEFELLGLRGDLDLMLDPQTRAPVELRGNIKYAGQVTVHLRRAVLRP